MSDLHEQFKPAFERLDTWWNHGGLVVSSAIPFFKEGSSGPRMKDEEKYADPDSGARWLCDQVDRQVLEADMLPFIDTDLGPGSLAVYLGCTPKTIGDTVWFHTPYRSREEIPEKLEWDDDGIWWLRTERLFQQLAQISGESNILPFPDLCENIDVLASLRGAENLMIDMLDDPAWVGERVGQIDEIYRIAISRLLPFVQRKDNSTAFHAFRLWGRGLTAKVQCDSAAMISRDMFDRFVVPSLEKQCTMLDNSLFHLDGTQSMQHLDSLLHIEGLKAIEWTPQTGIETGEHPRWYPMYRRILEAGKSVQILVGDLQYVEQLFNEVGTKGIYLLSILEYEDFQRLQEIAAPFRR